MKKLLGILVILVFWSSSLSAASIYGRKGKGPLKLSKNVANNLEYYFSGGRMGVYKKKQDHAWNPFFIVISTDGREYDYFVMPQSYSGSFEPGNYVGKSLQSCKKRSGKECFVFAHKYKIIWDNGSDKKKRKLKKKKKIKKKRYQGWKNIANITGARFLRWWYYTNKKNAKSKKENIKKNKSN